jgi:hypothetical protein
MNPSITGSSKSIIQANGYAGGISVIAPHLIHEKDTASFKIPTNQEN